jgi:hypothetical protein
VVVDGAPAHVRGRRHHLGRAAAREGRTAVSPVILAGEGTNWVPLALPGSADVRAIAAGGRVVAVGGAVQDKWLLHVSGDAGVTFRTVELPSAYSAVTGLAVSDGAQVIIGGYSGKPVENAMAVASRLDVATGALAQLDLPQAVQLLRLVCIPASCLGITPTGHSDLGDMIVRLQRTAGRWERMSRETTVPVFLERIFVGPASAYAVGSVLMRAQPRAIVRRGLSNLKFSAEVPCAGSVPSSRRSSSA